MVQEQREVLARRGDPVELSFDGEGWVFVSGSRGDRGGRGGGMDGLEFTGSAAERGRSRFSFAARELGDYLLGFQLQDHRAGVLRNEVVRLRVLEDDIFLREVGAASGEKGVGAGSGESARTGIVQAGARSAPALLPEAVRSAPAGTGPDPGASRESWSPKPSLELAEQLYSMGELEMALAEYLRNYRSGDPYLNARIAGIYRVLGKHLEAAEYFSRNLDADPSYRDGAVVGMVRCALALQDEEMIANMIPSFLGVASVPVREELLGIARYMQSRERGSTAMTLLKEYERRYPLGPGLDEVFYRMGELYESESPLRDLAAARAAYRKVYDQWPESRYAEAAHQRLQYLERHFFDVR